MTGTVSGTVSFTDPDGDSLTYSVIGEPAGVTIDPVTGHWTYVPSLHDRLKATDINATSEDQQVSFTIIASGGAASTGVLTTAPIAPLAISTIDVGAGPADVVISLDGTRVYITNTEVGTVSVITIASTSNALV